MNVAIKSFNFQWIFLPNQKIFSIEESMYYALNTNNLIAFNYIYRKSNSNKIFDFSILENPKSEEIQNNMIDIILKEKKIDKKGELMISYVDNFINNINNINDYMTKLVEFQDKLE